jgi:hypothetical protein
VGESVRRICCWGREDKTPWHYCDRRQGLFPKFVDSPKKTRPNDQSLGPCRYDGMGQPTQGTKGSSRPVLQNLTSTVKAERKRECPWWCVLPASRRLSWILDGTIVRPPANRSLTRSRRPPKRIVCKISCSLQDMKLPSGKPCHDMANALAVEELKGRPRSTAQSRTLHFVNGPRMNRGWGEL